MNSVLEGRVKQPNMMEIKMKQDHFKMEAMEQERANEQDMTARADELQHQEDDQSKNEANDSKQKKTSNRNF